MGVSVMAFGPLCVMALLPRRTGTCQIDSLGYKTSRMLFKKETLEGMKRGMVTVAFRRWPRPLAKVGGTQRTPAGVIAFDAVEPVTLATITEADAKSAGASSRDELLRWLSTPGRPAFGRKS